MGAVIRQRWFDNPATLRSLLVVFALFNLGLTAWFLIGDQPAPLLVPQFVPQPRPTSLSTEQHLAPEKIAFIVETRMLDNLIPLILHFSSVLGPSWHVVLFTMESTWEMPTSARFQHAIEEKRVSVRFLPPDTNLSRWKYVSRFLTRPWIWEQMRSAERVLLFQTDSIICSRSNWTADDFLQWDYIGAPLNPFMNSSSFNGGLSMRNPKLILDILASDRNDYDDNWNNNRTELCVEDVWYYTKFAELPHAKIPDLETAKYFSVESYWYDRPFGFHAPRDWNEDRMDEIWKYCPEVELVERGRKKFPINLTSDWLEW
ncbi:hypothetical protein GQ53DRAFT_141399 [Thozetella sp. PMI_491]|nr:hypothetical protein GQ53DRAFT_141399 [Thozetella sp. PMI_491]